MTISGPQGSEPISTPSGLSIRKDGAPVGIRDVVNMVTTPGVTPIVTDDATPSAEKTDLGWNLSALIPLATVTNLDLVAGVGTTVLVPALAGATVYLVSAIQVVPVTVDGAPGVQPVLQVETPAGAGDHVASAALVVAGDSLQDMLMVTTRPKLDSSAPNNLLNLVQTGLATAGSYVVDVIVWGYVLTP